MKKKVNYKGQKNINGRHNTAMLVLIAAILLLAAGVGYQYRESIFAGQDPEEVGASGPDENLEDQIPDESNSEEEQDQEENQDENNDTEEDKHYPPEEDEVLTIADGDYLLALVNKQTSLGKYHPGDLVPVEDELKLYDRAYQLREEAYQHLREMWEDARADGAEFYINSAFRSYETQEGLFNNYAAEHGEEEANKFSARPGQSEHQLGTTVDISIPNYVLSQEFAETEPGQWLEENAYKYGFVMSYPEGAEEITGYIYEPWHYRYIGVENAARWKESGLTLTEFLEEQPQEWVEESGE